MNRKHTCSTRATLLKRLCDADDSRSWYEFVYHYRPYIYGIIRKMNVSHHDTEEIVQLLLVKLADMFQDFDYDSQRGKFRSYLARMTVNCAYNYFRSRKNRDSAENEAVNLVAPFELAEVERLAESEWIEHLHKAAWKNISNSFGIKIRTIWELLQEGKTTSEIAETVKIREKSVYVYKKRIKDKLLPEIKRLKIELN